MSEDVKMSDLFNLPVDCGIGDLYGDGVGIFFEEDEPITIEQANAVDKAINSYDANQETIKQQQAVIEELKSLANVMCKHNCPPEYFEEDELDAFIEIEGLLITLKGGEDAI